MMLNGSFDKIEFLLSYNITCCKKVCKFLCRNEKQTSELAKCPKWAWWTKHFKLQLTAVYDNSLDVDAQWKEADFVQETCVTDTLLLDVNKNSQSLWQQNTINPVCPSILRVAIFSDGIKRICHPIKFSGVYYKISYLPQYTSSTFRIHSLISRNRRNLYLSIKFVYM